MGERALKFLIKPGAVAEIAATAPLEID
jgi:hypothetical protein